MKINERMRYPHPVLSEYSSDYVSGEFRCEFEQNMTADNQLRIAANLTVTSRVLTDLIADQKAAIGYYVVCRRTYFNSLHEAAAGRSEAFIDASRLFGAVIIRPVIWTLREIDNLSSPLFDREFGQSVRVPKGSIVAIGPEFRFSIDRKKYKPFDSIFELSKSDQVAPGTIVVDPYQDRITIAAEPDTFESITGMRNLPAGKKILLNAVYMPAVMDVIGRLQAGDQALEARKWYRVFRAKCDDLAIDPANPAHPPLELAQKLLKEPLKKTIDVMKGL